MYNVDIKFIISVILNILLVFGIIFKDTATALITRIFVQKEKQKNDNREILKILRKLIHGHNQFVFPFLLYKWILTNETPKAPKSQKASDDISLLKARMGDDERSVEEVRNKIFELEPDLEKKYRDRLDHLTSKALVAQANIEKITLEELLKVIDENLEQSISFISDIEKELFDN